jgi:hypothetical protein
MIEVMDPSWIGRPLAKKDGRRQRIILFLF